MKLLITTRIFEPLVFSRYLFPKLVCSFFHEGACSWDLSGMAFRRQMEGLVLFGIILKVYVDVDKFKENIRFDLPRRGKLMLIKPPTALALYMIPSQEAPASNTSIKNSHRGENELDRFVSDIGSQLIIFARLCSLFMVMWQTARRCVSHNGALICRWLSLTRASSDYEQPRNFFILAIKALSTC